MTKIIQLVTHLGCYWRQLIHIVQNGYPKTELIKDSDLIVASEHNTQYFFQLKGDTLLLLGHENPLIHFDYNIPFVQTVFPPLIMALLLLFHTKQKGIYSETDKISTEGFVTTVAADGLGRLVLPTETP